jgi:heme/copper-type cytochrome/quinol oxidase subunit 2
MVTKSTSVQSSFQLPSFAGLVNFVAGRNKKLYLKINSFTMRINPTIDLKKLCVL